MKLTFEEKKLLYTYGCADLELTRKRLYGVAGLTVDPDQNRLVYGLQAAASAWRRCWSPQGLCRNGSGRCRAGGSWAGAPVRG